MRRHFQVQEIDFDDFNGICSQVYACPSNYKTSKKGNPNLYLRLVETPEYPDIANLLLELTDKFQKPRVVWYDGGGLRIRSAKRETRENQHEYFLGLIKNEGSYTKLVAQLSHDPWEGYGNDSFDFVKVEGVWILRQLFIQSCNFHMYTFQGIDFELDPTQTDSIYGVSNKIDIISLESLL